MSEVLGGHRGHFRILRFFMEFGPGGLPGFYERDLSQGSRPNEFDFKEYQWAADVAINKATRIWGWDRRDSSQARCTEYYSIHRFIQFKWAQATLRQHIVSELNDLLRRLDIDVNIEVRGLKSARELAELKDLLHRREVIFADVLEKLK